MLTRLSMHMLGERGWFLNCTAAAQLSVRLAQVASSLVPVGALP
jgi:hypothetical protein